jgi:hypothetical protein
MGKAAWPQGCVPPRAAQRDARAANHPDGATNSSFPCEGSTKFEFSSRTFDRRAPKERLRCAPGPFRSAKGPFRSAKGARTVLQGARKERLNFGVGKWSASPCGRLMRNYGNCMSLS